MPPASQPSIEDAVALHRQGRLDEAEKIYTRLIKVRRDDFNALHLLGMLNHQRGKAGEAYRLISMALKVNPRSPEALSNLALVLHALKRDTEALASVDKALALAPDHLDALNNRGNVLIELKRPADAVVAFERVLAIEPRHIQARINRGNALFDLGRGGEAIVEYDAALAQQAGNPYAHYNRGNALRELGRPAEAVADYDRALANLPNHLNAWMNRGLALMALNRHHDALASFGKAAVLQPDNADVQFNEALALLTVGDYRRGFEKYEARWKRTGSPTRLRFRQKPWLGEYPLAQKTILLHAEQGLGDTIQFARYAPVLARTGAKVLLEVQPELKGLLSTLDGVTAVFGQGDKLQDFDVQCPLASLPLALKTELSNVPADIPYLRASDERLARWRERIDAIPRPRVAIAWSGRAAHVNDRNRSIAFADLEPLLSTPGVRFVSVQRDLRPADAERLAQDSRVAQVGDALEDFADTAAVLSLCDAVVCVDTSVAHLAAAMGRPTHILVPLQPDWRWTLDREFSPWYPAARLFRQAAPGDWAGALSRVSEALASLGSRAT